MFNSLLLAEQPTILTLTSGDALLISIIGIVLIMLVLTVLLFIVKLMSLVVGKTIDNKKQPESSQQSPSYTSTSYSTPVESARSLTLRNVSEQDAALIMAIVAYQTNIPIEELNFKSITLSEEGK